MKYESELIKDIVETRGHEKSSLHYESECVEKWIEEVKGAYPKLTDYQAEWLNYIIENPIGNFPYVALTDVTNATIENVVPYAYKSAILNGNTKYLDILSNKIYASYESATNIWSENKYKLWGTQDSGTSPELNGTIVSGTDVVTPDFLPIINHSTYKLTGNSTFKKIVFYDSNQTFISSMRTAGTTDDLVCNNIPSNARYVRFSFFPYESNTGRCSVVDENNNPINFRQLQLISCKMPVLTTTGKNLFDGEIEEGQFDSKGNPSNYAGRTRCKNFIKVPKNTDLYISIGGGNNASWTNIYFYNDKKEYTNTYSTVATNKTFNTGDASYIKWKTNTKISQITNVQIEHGTAASSYEPYKTNVLSCNEEVVLRGIGEVKDTLDCLTGEVTQCIGEIVLDGSESYTYSIHNQSTTSATYKISMANKYKQNPKYLCNKLPTKTSAALTESNSIYLSNTYASNNIYIELMSNITGGISIKLLKQWLTQNPITVQYELETKTIKTVDLTITNQNGESLSKMKPIEGTMNLTTSSDTIAPTFSGEIPVEATTQNLASFIKEE